MRVLYSFPNPDSVYAARFLYEGLKNAFADLGHEFRLHSADGDFERTLAEFNPDVFIYSLNFYHLKYIDLPLLERFRREHGTVAFCQVRAWNEFTSFMETRSIASSSLKDNAREVELIRSGLAGDVFWHWFGQHEPLMDGFEEGTGQRYTTILLGADKTLYYPDYDERFASDVAFVGSFLPAKRQYLREHLFPLREKYRVRTYGNDWTLLSQTLGHIQRAGQYFNIKPIARIRKPPLSLDDERKVYSSAAICMNVHEDQVRRTGSEINERTYKLLACGGFQIADDVAMLRQYFSPEELVIVRDKQEWFDAVDHYLAHPEERRAIAERGMANVLSNHTYHHRAQQIMQLTDEIRAARARA